MLDDERITQEKNEAVRKAVENAVQAWLLKAQLLTTQFAFEKAEKAYQAAIVTAPDNYAANFAYGLFSQQLNRFEKARTGGLGSNGTEKAVKRRYRCF